MTWRLNLPHGVDYNAIFHPRAFANVVTSSYSRLEPGHRIEVMPEDMSYIAELLVLEVNGPRVSLRQLFKIDLAEVGESNAEIGGYESFHIGKGKWKVKRLVFIRPSGAEQPERTWPNTFDSQHAAETFIRQTLIGTRA